MTTTTAQNSFRIRVAALIFAILAIVVRCNCQTYFQFDAKTTFQFTGKEPPVPRGPQPVCAWSDTLLIGPVDAPILRLFNVRWTPTDGGNLYYLAPGVKVVYSPGPGGKTVYVRAWNTTLEVYEGNVEKL
jgi:hypothetical protein